MKNLSIVMALGVAMAITGPVFAGESKSKFKDWVGSKPSKVTEKNIKTKSQTKAKTKVDKKVIFGGP